MDPEAWAAVACGGCLGALARWKIGGLVQDGYEFPLGTLAVNVLGTVLLGFVMEASRLYGVYGRAWRLLLATGLAGSLTTFSTFMYEAVMLYAEYEAWKSLAYIVLMLLAGTVSIILGRVLAVLVYG